MLKTRGGVGGVGGVGGLARFLGKKWGVLTPPQDRQVAELRWARRARYLTNCWLADGRLHVQLRELAVHEKNTCHLLHRLHPLEEIPGIRKRGKRCKEELVAPLEPVAACVRLNDSNALNS